MVSWRKCLVKKKKKNILSESIVEYCVKDDSNDITEYFFVEID